MKHNSHIPTSDTGLDLLMQRVGKQQPFRTPDGYFDALPGRMMQRIKARQRRKRFLHWAAAAALAGCIFGTGLMIHTASEKQDIAEGYSLQYIDDALDYSMINNMEIATYLTEAE